MASWVTSLTPSAFASSLKRARSTLRTKSSAWSMLRSLASVICCCAMSPITLPPTCSSPKQYKVSGAADQVSREEFTMDFTRWLFHSLHGGGARGSVSYPGLSAISLATDHVSAKGFDHPAYASDELNANLVVESYIDDLLQHFANDDNFIAQFIRLVSTDFLKPALAYYREHDDSGAHLPAAEKA